MYRLEVKRNANKEIKRLPTGIQRRIFTAIRALVHEPRPDGCKKLKSKGADLYALRVSDYRIIYEINGTEIVILVLRVRHRKEVYRDL